MSNNFRNKFNNNYNFNNYNSNKYDNNTVFNNKNIVCNNCGKIGHAQKQCPDPITSLGIICIKVNNEIKKKLEENYVHKDEFNIHNNININIIDDFKKYITNNKIEYLTIRRKHSLGYIEFIRGRYEMDNKETINHLIRQMTPDEIKGIKEKEFKELWEEVWKKTSYNKLYLKEMEESKIKFEKLREDNFFVDHVKNDYEEPEWGFPKGRRNQNEKNLKCALREFWEETGIDKTNLIVLNKLFPINEIFYGTNGVLYKHIYFIAIYNSEKEIGIERINEDQLAEIGAIKWSKIEDCLNIFRPYHEEKKKVITSLHNFLNNFIEN